LSAASDVLQTAVRIDSGNASAWTNLGSAELMLGRRERAKQAFERALAIDPTLEPARRGLAAVGGGT
jgi:cytochrome c-type biogenesis protein CcmH/NrfG